MFVPWGGLQLMAGPFGCIIGCVARAFRDGELSEMEFRVLRATRERVLSTRRELARLPFEPVRVLFATRRLLP